VTGSLSSGLAMMSFDDSFVRQRDESSRNKPKVRARG